MPWQANLNLTYTLRDHRCVATHTHTGPLRILQTLYPEGDAIAHNVLVHPPGGLVGGDTLDLTVQVHRGSHGLITTPGATRFYRSEGPLALQRNHLKVEGGARLEWLPLEALCYDGCHAENRLSMELEPDAELIGWDITALGLPQAQLPFERGSFSQHIEVPGRWLERATLDAQDTRLLDGPAGLAGHRCMASLFWVCGTALERDRKEHALELARAAIAASTVAATAGVTSPNPHVVVLRVLAPLVEPAMQLLREVRGEWRTHLWGLTPVLPRVWSM